MVSLNIKNLKESGAENLIRSATLFFQAGITALVWVSMPFAIESFRGSLFLIGIAASIGIFSQTLFRIPLFFYIERAGKSTIPSVSLIIAGLSLIILTLSQNFATYALGFAIFGFSSAMSTPMTGLKDSGLTIYKPLNDIYSIRVFSTLGIFVILGLSAVYKGSIDSLYAVLSLFGLIVGLFGLIMKGNKVEKLPKLGSHTSMKKFFTGGKTYLKSFDDLRNRRLTYLILITDLGIFLSITMTFPFISSLGSIDALSRSDIFIVFALFAVGAFFIETYGRILQLKGMPNILYFARPMIILISFLLFSLAGISSLFVSGLIFIFIWLSSDRLSASSLPNHMEPSDANKLPRMETTFLVPLSFMVPLIGSLLWYLSPRTLFAFALIPLAFSVACAFVVEERFWPGHNTHGKPARDLH
ncbi:MAG: hypothetical protein AAE983_04230 [Thermoplasmataceae archaeon]|jgi:hypothetical protein